MTGPDTDRLTETLAKHIRLAYGTCSCGEVLDAEPGEYSAAHRRHQAAALRPTIDALLTEQGERIEDELRPVAADAVRSAFDDDPERLSASLTRVGNNLARIARQEAHRG